MKTCPNCGADLTAARKLVRTSARDLVEGLTLDAALLSWCNRAAPQHDPQAELDAFKDRMRACDYKTNAGPVKDASAAFRTHMRNAVKFGIGKRSAPLPSRTFARAAKKEE